MCCCSTDGQNEETDWKEFDMHCRLVFAWSNVLSRVKAGLEGRECNSIDKILAYISSSSSTASFGHRKILVQPGTVQSRLDARESTH